MHSFFQMKYLIRTVGAQVNEEVPKDAHEWDIDDAFRRSRTTQRQQEPATDAAEEEALCNIVKNAASIRALMHDSEMK